MCGRGNLIRRLRRHLPQTGEGLRGLPCGEFHGERCCNDSPFRSSIPAHAAGAALLPSPQGARSARKTVRWTVFSGGRASARDAFPAAGKVAAKPPDEVPPQAAYRERMETKMPPRSDTDLTGRDTENGDDGERRTSSVIALKARCHLPLRGRLTESSLPRVSKRQWLCYFTI